MNELKYLQTYRSKNTVNTYKTSLKTFLVGIYGEGDLGDLANRYFQDSRNYESDVRDFLSKIKDAPPKTIRLRLSSVRTFLLENNVELRQIFWRNLSRRIQGNDARTDDKVPSNLELRRILTHMNVQGKALYLTLSSSGMRIGETLKLKLGDIDLSHDPPQINVRGEYTKSGNRRVTFISQEAKEHVQEWLRCRDGYLKSSSNRGRGLAKSGFNRGIKNPVDDRLFPFDVSTANFIWTNAIDKAELNHRDPSTNRVKIHIHTLRKFFRTRLGSVIPTDVVEQLMGHEGYLTKEYRKVESEELAKQYKKGESSLIVIGGNVETVARMDELNGNMSGLKREIEELKKDYGHLEDVFNKSVDKLIARIKNLEREREQDGEEDTLV